MRGIRSLAHTHAYSTRVIPQLLKFLRWIVCAILYTVTSTKVRSRSPCTRKYYCKNCLRKGASYPAYRKYLWQWRPGGVFYAAQRTGRYSTRVIPQLLKFLRWIVCAILYTVTSTKVRSRSPCIPKYYCKNSLRKGASYPAYRKYLWPMASRRSLLRSP